MPKIKVVEVEMRTLDKATQDIPVIFQKEEMFVDALTFALKRNSTEVETGANFPVKWKINNLWHCNLNGIVTASCKSPMQLSPDTNKLKEQINDSKFELALGNGFPVEELKRIKDQVYEEASGDAYLNLLKREMVQTDQGLVKDGGSLLQKMVNGTSFIKSLFVAYVFEIIIGLGFLLLIIQKYVIGSVYRIQSLRKLPLEFRTRKMYLCAIFMPEIFFPEFLSLQKELPDQPYRSTKQRSSFLKGLYGGDNPDIEASYNIDSQESTTSHVNYPRVPQI